MHNNCINMQKIILDFFWRIGYNKEKHESEKSMREDYIPEHVENWMKNLGLTKVTIIYKYNESEN